MQFARRFWIAAACTLGLLLSTSALQAQNTKLLPNDTEMVVTFNLQQILKSEVMKGDQAKLILGVVKGKISEQLDEKGIDKWLKKANFDLFKDLNSITFAIPGGRNPEEGFILLEGNFDAEKIEDAATEASKEAGGGLKVVMIGKFKAFEVSPKDEKSMYVGILNKKTMIACATKSDFAEAAARLAGDKAPKFKSEVFKSLLETTNSKQSISFAATSAMLLKLAEKAPEGAGGAQAKQAIDVLKQMDGFSAAVTIQKNIDFQLGVNTKDNETASKYAGLGNILIGAAKAKLAEQAKQNEKLQPAVDIINTIRITSQASNLMVRGQITLDTLEKLLQNLPIPGN
jgi:hypothetical protein